MSKVVKSLAGVLVIGSLFIGGYIGKQEISKLEEDKLRLEEQLNKERKNLKETVQENNEVKKELDGTKDKLDKEVAKSKKNQKQVEKLNKKVKKLKQDLVAKQEKEKMEMLAYADTSSQQNTLSAQAVQGGSYSGGSGQLTKSGGVYSGPSGKETYYSQRV